MRQKEWTNEEIAYLASQLALILQAGMTPYEGLVIFNEDQSSGKTEKVLTQLIQQLEQGVTLSQAMKSCQIFPTYMIHMIKIGESSGKLEDVLLSLHSHYQRLHDCQSSIKSAVTYPFIMIIMMLIVIGVLTAKVLPIFDQVFAQLGTSMTGISKLALDFGKLLAADYYVIVIIFLLFIVAAVYLLKNSKGKRKLYHFLANWHITRKPVLLLALSQLSSGMAIALNSGLSPKDSLDMAAKLIDHKMLSKRIAQAKELLEDHDLADSFSQSQIFTGIPSKLLKIGDRTGQTDKVLQNIADRYNQEANERINHLISIIEPSLVIFLAVMVGIILLSVMLPLLGIMTNI